MKKFYLIIGILIISIIVFSVLAYFFPREEEPEEVSLTGYLIINNPGLTSDAWHLSYEERGSPGLIKQLIFSEKVICDKANNCIDLLGYDESLIGKKVKIKGFDLSDYFHVNSIEFLEIDG